ncbi:ABC transporter permease [Polynucleobacter sp. AP-Kaivos-20-H2]|nr:ABC transporter permease [Polynucleobacter sp. AP-Kaivos-20-H2]
MLASIASLWQYRAFILGSTKREFQTKYKNSLLGFAWPIINPLALILVYTLVFSKVMGARLPSAAGEGGSGIYSYSIYLCIGVIVWTLFAELTSRAQVVFLENANLLKKLNFPRLCLPVIVIFNAGLNFLIIFSLFTIFLVVTNNFPGYCFFAVIPLLAILIAFAIGLGMTLGVLNVFFRDIGYFYSVALQFWFWLTPIVYSVNVLPEKIRFLVAFNPLTNLLVAFQGIFINHQMPDWSSLWLICVLAILLNINGFRLFRKRSGEMVDLL